jgi:subtilisin-like proprotein convertase family protein
VVCAAASPAFAASTFVVSLSATTDDLTKGFFTDSTSNTGGDVGSEDPALTHLINGDSIEFLWSNPPPSGRITGTHIVQQTDRDCQVDNGCLVVGGGFNSGSSTNVAGHVFTVTAPAPSGTDYFYDCGFHGPTMNGHFHVASFGALDHFAVLASSPQTAGTPFTVTIQARDRNDNVVVGSFSVTMSNPTGSGAVFSPSTVNLVNGVGSTSANIHTSGSQTIRASGTVVSDSSPIFINPGPATHYLVSAPATATAGQNVNFDVTAQDQFNNTATAYAGTVHFTSSDGTAVKPADSTLVSGTKGFGVTFNTPGSQTIVATDTVTGTITGSDTVTVNSSNCPSADKTFTNSAAITINDFGTAATPYPSNITVSGLVNQVVGKVTVTLHGFHHTFISDIDILLVSPAGQKFILMSAAASGRFAPAPFELTFDDGAPTVVPQSGPLTTGSYQPTAYAAGTRPTLNAPAPAAPYLIPTTVATATLQTAFAGSNPNGTWSLYIQDNAGADVGAVDGGWSITITPAYDKNPNTAAAFSNTTPIAFNINPQHTTPYPSTISVSGVPGNIANVSLTLNGLTDVCPVELEILLQAPTGQTYVPFSGVGDCTLGSKTVTFFTLDDNAASSLPPYSNPLSAGFFKPTSDETFDFGGGFPVSFIAPAPAGPYTEAANDGSATFTSVFKGLDPNGTWKLYVLVDAPPLNPLDSGQFSGGWSLRFIAQCPAPTNCTVASSQNPTSFNQATTFTATVTSGAGTPTGNVTFTDTSTATTLASNVVLNGAGQASAGPFSNLSVGTHNIVANYTDGITFDVSTSPPLGQVVNKANTTTALVSSVNPTTYNQSTTFTAFVVGAFGGTPTGTVTFFDNGTPIASNVPLSGAQASFAIQTLAVGTHPITAVYNGDGSYKVSPASNTVNQVVNKASTTSVVVSSVNPSTFGQPVVFTGTVNSTNGITPTGTVTYFDGGTAIASNVALNGSGVGGSGLISNLGATPSTHNITIVYSGDGNFTGSTSPIVTQTVNKASTTVAVTSSANPSTFGVGVTLTGTISITSPGAGTPTGTITFKDGATTLGTGVVQPNKKATFATSALAAGAHSITAIYGGDSNFKASPTSSPFSQTVNQSNTTTTISVPNAVLLSGQPTVFFRHGVDLTATIDSDSGPAASGNVTFLDNGVTLGTAPVVSGTAVLPGVILGTIGKHTIEGDYSDAQNNYTPSSNTVDVQQSPRPH